MKKTITLFALLGVISTSLFAQEESETEKKFTFSGSVDAYYRTNLTGPNGEDAIAPGSSFANLDGFALGMANIVASYEGEKVGFVADLVFGPRGTDAIFASPIYSATGNIVNQLYAYWN
ncbi:MAG: outer membrane beta-barrel protein, partial [Flavobacteriaceae bacterium]|nr:porin [Bacteroidia bacterium]NNL60691.1 outer membrane beta-barrel protein [Flavobacteriaceae bacterium]